MCPPGSECRVRRSRTPAPSLPTRIVLSDPSHLPGAHALAVGPDDENGERAARRLRPPRCAGAPGLYLHSNQIASIPAESFEHLPGLRPLFQRPHL